MSKCANKKIAAELTKICNNQHDQGMQQEAETTKKKYKKVVLFLMKLKACLWLLVLV
jgi:hypothetical protein